MKVSDVAQKAATSEEKKAQPGEVHEHTADSWSIHIKKTRICTLEQLIEHCNIDLEQWTVEKFICNKWEVGAIPRATREAGEEEWSRPHNIKTPAAYPMQNENGWNGGLLRVYPLFQVKAFLRRNKAASFAREQVEALRAEAKKFVFRFPPTIKARSSGNSGNMAEFSIMDAHFGSRIWGEETGSQNYDLDIAAKCYRKACESLILRVRDHKPSKAVYVIGSDQHNADNRAGTTERGTSQTNAARYQKVFIESKRVTRWMIDLLLAEFGAVDVIPIPGNHDPLATWHLADSLAGIYERCKQVKIRTSPRSRQFYQHGVCMLMFEHGNNGKLEEYDKTMAAEQPKMWGETLWREAHTGDKHHRRLVELKGATVRILPSLRPPCAWTAENHFVGALRAAEAYVWNEREGLVGTAVYSILNSSKSRLK